MKIPKNSQIKIKLTILSNVDWINAGLGLKKSSKIATIYEQTIEGRPPNKQVFAKNHSRNLKIKHI